MAKLTLADVKDLTTYEKERDQRRTRVIALKQRRRLQVGDNISLLFENRETVLHQVQEMVRTERIVQDERIQDELDAYNPLLPGGGELSATLFIEIPGIVTMSDDEVRRAVNRFQGLDKGAVRLRIGQETIPARFESGQTSEEKMAAVQYIRFAVPQAVVADLADPATPARLAVEHPNYRAEEPIPPAMRQELLRDLGD
jgi:hypothetical protein